MPRITILALAGVVACAGTATSQDKSQEQQIAEAVTPLPEAMRAGATVYGYRGGELVTLRQGSGMMVCLADDPSDDRWHVACYHESLDPYMAKGREIRAQGTTDRATVARMRKAAISSGELKMPEAPAALYSLTGSAAAFDPQTGTVTGASSLYVVYVPYATSETTGLPTRPAGGGPWLMAPGEPWAHIMISGGGR
jgi:hypothetical protein